ncbi:helix-turn-helix domain-containing protein [Actinacidiphila oryziradicis]|uniref:Helix-turn-helix transcriptional regulator n=1 Tax=Actinacidiphila oryziradicis TaxID=2571141 RepID=A0A4V5N0S7_9ACTN|nr:helix-turn-helix transcriptional regulator [Actinacidiphila oryziradicis]TKA13189.1 helix-turn-helix transcriptional regulator [Actinacidiphila oryziradicis]
MAAEIRMRRTPPAGLGPMLGAARMRRGWRMREAARLLELSPSYLFDLEAGRRCPSVTVARQLADGLGLDETERAQLLAATVDDAGRDHPARHSV